MAEAALKSEPSPAPATQAAAPVLSSEKLGPIQQARQDIEARLRAYRPTYSLSGVTPNVLNGRYHIRTDQPLPEFSRPQMKACAVADANGVLMPYYAAICESSLPYRHTSMEKLMGVDHPHLIRLVDHGVVLLGDMGEQRHVLLFEKPQGRTLAELMAEGMTFNEQRLHEQILTPLSSVLTALEELGINHCYINPNNIFISEKVVLGECISQPAGYAQEFIYEPVERIAAIPQGKGGGSLKVDVYAIGVLVVEVLFRLTRLRTLTQEQLISVMLQQGCYNVIAGNGEFSEYFHDLLRGTLCDDPADRWGPAQLAQWITGKRFNIIHPSTPREASRPFSFEGKDYFNRKALAHAFFTHWESARNFIRGAKLERWMEQSIQLTDEAELLTQLFNSVSSSNKSAKKANDLLTRTLIILDPSGPIRTEHLAFNADAVGKMLSEAIYNKRQTDLALVIDVMVNDLAHFWTERQRMRLTSEFQESIWKIQNVRSMLTNNHLGFGIERCLYEMNHDLPCYSPLLKAHYVTNLSELMQVLDALATEKPSEFSLFDRHLAAFTACKAMINTEVRINEISAYSPALAQNRELQALMLFAKAQSKSGLRSLPGLSMHAALTVLGILENVHSQKIRETLAERVRQVASDGSIQTVLNALLDPTQLERDHHGYNHAREMYLRNQFEINKLRDREELKKKVKDRAHRWASLLSMFIFLITCAYAIQDIIG